MELGTGLKRAMLLGLLLAVVPGVAFAASPMGTDLYVGTGITGDTESDWVCFDQRPDELVFELIATHNSGSSTLDVEIITRHDALAESDPIITFAQITTTDDSERKTLNPTVFMLRCVKAVIDVGAAGSPNYDIVVRMLYRQTL